MFDDYTMKTIEVIEHQMLWTPILNHYLIAFLKNSEINN